MLALQNLLSCDVDLNIDLARLLPLLLLPSGTGAAESSELQPRAAGEGGDALEREGGAQGRVPDVLLGGEGCNGVKGGRGRERAVWEALFMVAGNRAELKMCSSTYCSEVRGAGA